MQTETGVVERRGWQAVYDEIQLVLFTIAEEVYAVPVLTVEEIIRYQPITAVPRAPEFVKGVLDLRGRVIPVVDLRERLGLPPSTATSATRIVVMEAAGSTVGLVVDSVDEVRTIGTSEVQPPSAAITTAESEFLVGVGRLSDGPGAQQLVILLDADRVMTFEQRSALAEAAAQASG
jgi:purine-binding chemotaxis protein CheW